MIKGLMFGVGASKGILLLGSIKCLIEKEVFLWENIEVYAGVSIGGLISFALVIGYTVDDTIEFFEHFDCASLDCEYKLESLLENFGINDGEKCYIVMRELLENKLSVKNITFLELFEKTQKTFVIQVCNLTKKRIESFSHKTHPDFSVLDAVRMTISVPFYFTPVIHQNDYYVDPGILLSVPQFDNKLLSDFNINAEECIVFQLENSLDCEESNYDTFIDYCYDIFRTFYYKSDIIPDKFNTIKLNVECENILPDKSTIIKLVELGYQQTLLQYDLIQK